MEYNEFLGQKRIVATPKGKRIEESDISPVLFPFQRDITLWAVHKGQCAIFADTGLGKTLMQIEWARLMNERALIIAPLSVARQTVRISKQLLDLDIHYTRDGADLVDGINITNYEMVRHFDPDKFGAVVLDECLVGDTLVDTTIGTIPISDIRRGHLVWTAAGLRRVRKTICRHKDILVLTSIQGHDIISSENHPFLTLRGWVRARYLKEGDHVVYTTEAMRMVQEGFDRCTARAGGALLREILLCEMEDESARDCSQGTHSRNTCRDRCEEKRMVQSQVTKSHQGIGEDQAAVPHKRPRGQSKNIQAIAGNRAQAESARRQRQANACSAAGALRCPGGRMGGGIQPKLRETTGRLSDTLQDRYCKSNADGSHRSGRLQSRCHGAKDSGCEKGCEVAGARVDSVTVYKSGDPVFARYCDATGRAVLYDIEVEGHPSFSVHGLLVHNSSILKALTGKTRRMLIKMFGETPYRLCCTATPAPNDMTELGNHAEFLGICTEAEMRAMFFINANKEHTTIVDENGHTFRRKGSNIGGQEWRLKRPAEQPFFRWMSSWAMSLTKPSNLGYDNEGFVLPQLNIYPQFVGVQYTPDDQLMFTHLRGIADRHDVRRKTLSARLDVLRDLVSPDGDEQWIVWVGLDEESKQATALFEDAIEVKGSHTPDYKSDAFEAFQDGQHRILITKGRCGGFGMNFQNAHNMAFLGLNDSWETWYQCIRREYRYGQTQAVNVHVIMSDIEAEIYHNVMRKDAMASRLRAGLLEHITRYEQEELTMDVSNENAYQEQTIHGNEYTMMLGDSCKRLKELDADSIDLSVYSPPFADLFVYSSSSRDLGNSRGWDEFFSHYRFIIKDLLRVTKPGRLSCVHTSDIPAMQNRDGYIGIKDFPGEVLRAHEAEGWTFVGRAFVQKNPQAQAIRVKSKALLFVQMRKDSASSRPALVDQILIFRKPGDNATPITPVDNGEMDNETWIEWAHGIWIGIRETDTLQYGIARGADDEKHICPLQLGTIERCVKLYSNPGETVLSPFAGIGSEGYVAVQFGRRFIGIELKPEYFEIAMNNLSRIEIETRTPDLFEVAGIAI